MHRPKRSSQCFSWQVVSLQPIGGSTRRNFQRILEVLFEPFPPDWGWSVSAARCSRGETEQQEMERPNDGERDSSNDAEPPVMSPSRKRSRAPIITTSNVDPDSDDDSDYCTDASRSPSSLSPCPSPKRWGENCFETPPVRRKFVHEKFEEENVEIFPTPATPSTNLIKMRIWQRSNYLNLIDLTLICTTPSHRYFGDNNIVDRPCPTCGLLINANALNFEVSLNSSLPLFLLLSLDTL
jgi:hypothetical protein